MRILGVDCSSNKFAYSVFDDGDLVRHGMFTFGKGDAWHRFNNAQRVINRMIDLGEFDDVDAVYVEAAVYVNNRRTVILLAHAFGAALSPLARPGVKMHEVPAITWQNFIGNKVFSKAEKEELKKNNPGKSASWYKEAMRKERKQRTRRWVKETYGLDIDDDDLTDAIGVGHYGVHHG